MNGDIERSVKEIVAKVCRCDINDISADTSRSEVKNWDSFAHINIVMMAESQLGISIPIEKIADIKSIRDIVKYAKN